MLKVRPSELKLISPGTAEPGAIVRNMYRFSTFNIGIILNTHEKSHSVIALDGEHAFQFFTIEDDDSLLLMAAANEVVLLIDESGDIDSDSSQLGSITADQGQSFMTIRSLSSMNRRYFVDLSRWEIADTSNNGTGIVFRSWSIGRMNRSNFEAIFIR